MINKISASTNIIPISRNIKAWKIPQNFNELKYLAKLKTDFFQKENKPEYLNNNPAIQIGKFNTGINDSRLEAFWTEKRAYTYPMQDDEFPNDYICIDSKGKRRLKPHIYINMIEVKPEFAHQGICSKIEQEIITFAKENGFNGRIVLDATKIESPIMTKIPSPSLAHWKNGFRFTVQKYNEIMNRVLSGELPLDKAPEGTMYYPNT